MLNFFLQPVRMLALALVGNDTARQTAWGFALGMMVGLLPKGNLLAVALATLLCALRVNRTAGLLALGLFSYVGAALDDAAHRIGSILLTWSPTAGVVAWIEQQPLGPFTGLNNTVVLGQLAIGLYLLYPTYRGARTASAYVRPRLRRYLMRYRVVR